MFKFQNWDREINMGPNIQP